MPLYEYHCDRCTLQQPERRPVEMRDDKAECWVCGGTLGRVFTPTAHIFVDEHFRHLQSDFLPDREDKKGWEARGTREWDSQRHEQKGPELKPFLEAELLREKREKVTLSGA